jgi:hypothetical protein
MVFGTRDGAAATLGAVLAGVLVPLDGVLLEEVGIVVSLL